MNSFTKYTKVIHDITNETLDIEGNLLLNKSGELEWIRIQPIP